MGEFNTNAYSRNLGFLNKQEQQRLADSVVAIAGAGGDGGMLAVQMARLGVGELRLADPDPFETENINRQACCTTNTIGLNKARAVGEYVQAINPNIGVSLYEQGITEDNVEEFVQGADLLIDETEFTIHTLGVMLAREARNEGISDLMAMNIGFGATVTSFRPGTMSFEEMLGFKNDEPLDKIAAKEPETSRWLPYIPPYGDLNVFKKVASGDKPAPSIGPGVAMAAGIATTQAMLHLFDGRNKRPNPIFAPRVLVMDAMTGKSNIIRLSRISHYRALSAMAARSSLHMNPEAGY